MLKISAAILQVAYPEMTYNQAYMCQVRHLQYDTWGKYSEQDLLEGCQW